jgi:ribonuclease D
MTTFDWVDDDKRLKGLVDAVARSPSLGIDTEFVRTDTFHARLGVIQIEADARVFLVDALDQPLLQVLGEALLAQGGHWLLHAGAEDLEVLRACWPSLRPQVFDTQIAAAFAGHPRQASLQSLLAAELGISISKDETRSDWCQRPLTPSQQSYAAQDVAHLQPLAESLRKKLAERGRLDWCLEDCERLVEKSAAPAPDPDTLYLGFSEAWQLGDASLSVLRALVAWRERTARQLDRPRGFILKDPALFRIAETLPRHAQAISTMPTVVPAQVRRYAAAILEIVAGTPVVADLPRPPRPLDATQRRIVKELRQAVDRTAESLGLPPDLLATRKWLEELVRLTDLPEQLPPVWGRWRQELLGEGLLATVAREKATGGVG